MLEKRGVSIIKCECGFEIPVIADAKLLGRAIDEHIEEHRKKYQTSEDSEIVADRVQNNLFKQLFEKIAQMNI